MRISDWSSDVCSSDLPSGNRSTPAKRPRSSASATASCSICSKGRRRTRSTSSRAAPPTRDPRLAPASPRRYLVRVLPYRRRDLPFLWHAERSEEHTSELQSLMRISYAVFCLKKKKKKNKYNVL